MSTKEIPFPKALNIIRPSSPLTQQRHDSSYSTSTTSSSSPSSISTISNISTNYTRVQPTIINPSNFALYQNNWNSFKPPNLNTVGVNPHRFLSRPRSNSNLSKSTYFSTLSMSSLGSNHTKDEEDEEDYDDDEGEDDDEEDDDDDLDSIDGTSEDEEELPTKIVAKIKHGTIMNGKGEFVNKGREESTWLDEARANRKIADLEIEKASLLVLNTTLEAKLRQQTAQIVELQNRLQMNEGPLTPVSDKHAEEFMFNDDDDTVVQSREDEEADIENDQVFQRIKSMLEGLILQAQVALIHKSKQSGKVLQDYNYPSSDLSDRQLHVEEALHKLTVKTSPTSLVNACNSSNFASPKTPTSKRTSPLASRRVSDASSVSSRSSSVKMSRNLSRQSSPPVMVTSPRPFSPPLPQQQQHSSQRRSSSPRHISQLRKSQDLEKPKWHF